MASLIKYATQSIDAKALSKVPTLQLMQAAVYYQRLGSISAFVKSPLYIYKG